MKKALLFSCLWATSLSFGQKILNAVVDKEFDENGNVEYVDSVVNNYTSGNYYLNELKPKFGYDGDILYYFMEDLFIHCQSTDEYQGFSYPLAHIGTTTNTLTNDLVTSSEFGGGSVRSLFAYDAQDRKISEVYQFFNGTTWNSNDSIVFEYDAAGNKTLEAEYNIGGGGLFTILEYVDSLWYEAGTDHLTKSSNYYHNGTNLVLDYQTLVFYNGNEIDYLDLLESDGSGGLDLYFRLDYLYSGSVLTGFDAYEVVNNVPSATATIIGDFTYTPQNEIESYTLTEGNDTLERAVFNYDTEGFVNRVDSYEEGNTGMYLAWVVDYHFTNVAALNEVKNLEVSIYPNPTVDILNIQSTEKMNQIQVFNMMGNLILEQNNTTKIDVSHLSTGTYIIKGLANDKTFTKTFLKQ